MNDEPVTLKLWDDKILESLSPEQIDKINWGIYITFCTHLGRTVVDNQLLENGWEMDLINQKLVKVEQVDK
jgi:Rieske Fe-S protein